MVSLRRVHKDHVEKCPKRETLVHIIVNARGQRPQGYYLVGFGASVRLPPLFGRGKFLWYSLYNLGLKP